MEHQRNGAICFKLSRPKGEPRNKVEYLLEQAARAERLARSIVDTVTVERLQAFAAECCMQAKILNMRGLEAA
jgi:hypothetical protein